MAIIQVHSENIEIKYKSTLISKAFLFSIINVLLKLILPFIIAYCTGDFWRQENIFYEQPQVNMKGEYLIVLTTDNHSHPIVCSNFIEFEKESMKDLDRCDMFQLKEQDYNYDYKPDQVDFRMRINLLKLKTTSLTFILPINYEIKTICPLKLQSAIIFENYFNQKTVTDITIKSDLSLYQKSALMCNKDYSNIYKDLFLNNGDKSIKLQPNKMIELYNNRNLTTHLINVYIHKESTSMEEFNLKLTVNYPEHKIYYKTGFWHKMKMAWVQFVAIFIIINWTLNKLTSYMYYKKWFLCYEVSPIKKQI